ncbi:MAG: thioredoxin domain-containing protein [Acidobacteriaceae bacterium]
MSRFFAAVLFFSLVAAPAPAQTAVPAGQGDPFKDTSMFKPPAGAKVAIIEWEDLECPACAHAFPIVHEAAKHYNIPLIRRDFQIPGHIWSHEASIYARYLQDKVSPAMGEEYRREVFASQYLIASKDDLHNFTVKFFQTNHQAMPFVVDPTGQFAKEVGADSALGEKMGLRQTPTIIVATNKSWVQVKDVMQLYSVIDAALAQTAAAPAKAPVKKAATVAHKKS